MDLSELESQMSHLLAKSSPAADKPAVTLFRHSLDVTWQMAEYCRIYNPQWPVSDDPICLNRVLAYAALIHDFGKIHTGFQAALAGGPKFQNRHEILSLAFIGYLEIPDAEQPWLEAAIGLHHKNLFHLIGAGKPFYLGSTFTHPQSFATALVRGVKASDIELLRHLLIHAKACFERQGWNRIEPYNVLSGTVDLIGQIRAALERICRLEKRFHAWLDDWGKPKEPVPWSLRRAGVLVRGLILNADHLASFQPHPLSSALTNVQSTQAALPPDVRKLNSHQQKACEQAGSAILIAPTGKGKTEAGLLWAARQSETAGLKGRTFILLPYQASMNAMQERLNQIFAPGVEFSSGEWNKNVAVVHGRSMRAAYERLLDQNYSPSKAADLAHFQSDLARLNVAPIRICSPFQIIRLLFATKATEGLMVPLSDAKFIFDEVHAYRPDITALALSATHFLTERFGSRALFMTATMPTHLNDAIQRVFGRLPLLKAGDDVLGLPPRHRLRLVPWDVLNAKSVDEIKDCSKQGSVLVVVNQVKRAKEVCKLLQAAGVKTNLLHSRFTHKDRSNKEKLIKPAAGAVLVATQAVEVSLDIDYDRCFSELAPVESLLQRFGRCNRHGHQTTPAEVTVFQAFPAGSRAPWRPYEREHLDRTLQTLTNRAAVDDGLLPDSTTQDLLDSSYPETLKRELTDEIETKCRKLQELFIEPFAPFGMKDDNYLHQLESEWEQLFDGNEILPYCLRDEARTEESWLGRARYLVPISGRRYAALRAQGLIEWDEELMCDVADVPYTEDGLDV